MKITIVIDDNANRDGPGAIETSTPYALYVHRDDNRDDRVAFNGEPVVLGSDIPAMLREVADHWSMQSSLALTPDAIERKSRSIAALDEAAAALDVAVGQVWEHIGTFSLMDPSRRMHATGARIRIVQVAGADRKRTTRYVKVNPPRGGNGGRDHQSHPITARTLARAYRLIDDSTVHRTEGDQP